MPYASQPHANLGVLFEAVGRSGDAESELRAALRLAPDDIEVVGHLARIHVQQSKRTAETIGWLESIAAHDDNDEWRRWAQGQLARGTHECNVTGED